MFIDPSVLASFSTAAFRYGHFAIDDFPGRDECDIVYKHGKPSDDPDYKPIQLGAKIQHQML